ncbi:MAG: pyruvate:ferredoxin (flavodoxin) oxidoreductase [Oscillospiraceae bacterium]|nr:pyruvate:ferredoxin (flavodoxin) oxidoreductase [Oscillospiraceae bacterium]
MARKMKTMDGNTAAAHVSYAYTDVAAIYPITPSSNMAEVTDEWASKGLKNIFGDTVKVVEMQSEAGAAAAVHGSLAAGGLTTTYTASQGLLLMIPNMYKIAGELLPGVIQVSARTIASHALSIFGDHSDVMACRQTGFAILACNNVQEIMDLTPVAHLAALKGRIPFLNFFDGFRNSHEVQKIEVWDFDDLAGLADFDIIEKFRSSALNPAAPKLRGSAQNPDVFFQAREACNKFYDELPDVAQEYMDKINKKIGTNYKLFNYYGAPDAEHILVAMGSACDTIEETIDYLNSKGIKTGLVKVRLFRPFSAKHLIEAIPDSVKLITVLDRTKEPGAFGEPLFLDVVAALKNSKFDGVKVLGGRYGLSSKDTTPAQIISVFKNKDKERFTIGINDDVTYLSLPIDENPDTTPAGTTSCKFWGLGADGTVGANKNSIKIIGDHTEMYAQAYFSYDSKKSGGVTVSHLRFGKQKIKSSYLVNKADFVACHNPSYVDKYTMTEDLKKGGVFLLNCGWDMEHIEQRLPNSMKRFMAQNDIKFYTIDGISIAKELGLGGRVNTILQAAFFKLANIIPISDAVKYMKDAATNSYSKKGDHIVKMNHDAIDRGINDIKEIKVPGSWAGLEGRIEHTEATGDRKDLVDFVNNILIPVSAQKGDTLPVSAFCGREDGTLPQGTSQYEKRGIAVDVPRWAEENCIQCNFCAYVCPHAVLRPVAMNGEELSKAPGGTRSIPMNGVPGMNFVLTVSALDCYGCGVCVTECPGKKGQKALEFNPLDSQLNEQNIFAYGLDIPEKPEVAAKFKDTTVKGSQFKRPLLEFSGACAGCGETPYAKLATQLFGDRMYIGNATGCSSIWGGSTPSTPYTVNKEGRGPTWANSLFEDAAEFSYGMYLSQQAIRDRLAVATKELISVDYCTDKLKESGQKWLDTYYSGAENKLATDEYIKWLEDGINVDLTGTEWEAEWLANDKKCTCDACKLARKILTEKNYLMKKSVWAIGGDGWAYDIGFGGLDHVAAEGQDVNMLVFDTEVYSNTGGQMSKSTPTGAIAQFAAAGKGSAKKDLAQMLMSYGCVYVAQVAMGADYNQCLKAFHEAESYNGPSIIIAYAPCINHGIKGGMAKMQREQKRAVDAGYWFNFRFDPRKKDQGENPFQLDSKAPTASFREFLSSEVRYNALERQNPTRAARLFESAEKDSKEKYAILSRMKNLYEPE